jgi:hypothetical protein
LNTDTYKLLGNHELITDAFGYWPSFHDAEIHRFVLERTEVDGVRDVPCIEFIVHVHEMTSQTDEKGHYILQKHHRVHFKFEGISELKLEGFNHQNVVFSLEFERISNDNSSLKVTLEPCYGVDAGFVTEKGYVLSMVPCDEGE